MKRLLPTN